MPNFNKKEDRRFFFPYIFRNLQKRLKYKNKNIILQDTEIHFSHQSR